MDSDSDGDSSGSDSEVEELPMEGSLDVIHKKIKSLEEQFSNRGKPNLQVQNIYVNNKNNRASVPIQERPMTITEKNLLGSKIRMLSQEQMKGIINILSDQYSIENNSKFFEFDIESLSTKKLRELEKYVKKEKWDTDYQDKHGLS